MRSEDVSQVISNISDKYIEEAIEFAPDKTHHVRWGVLAACFVMFIIIGSVGTAFAVEAKEYKAAVAFFEENGLSVDGLSRSEIKAVYRDITNKRFVYGKTAEVLRQAVPGWEIEQDEPSPEELAELWNIWTNNPPKIWGSYRVDSKYVYDEKRGFEVLDKCILEYYQDSKMLWSAEFTDFYVDGYAKIKEGTMVWGSNLLFSSSDVAYGWIAFVDNSGNVVWQTRLDHGFKFETIASVLKNKDDTFAVISRGDSQYICLSCCDAKGRELSFHKTQVGNLGIRNAARLGDGYIVQLWNQYSGDTALLYKMDREGNLTDSFSYEADDCDYYITDMAEYEGRVYLSAYAVPKQVDEGGRHEIANILDYAFSKMKNGEEVTGEELTLLVRDNYTALLLICDPEDGTPKTFYSVKGSMGSGLSVNEEDLLEWNVASIVATTFSPATNAYTIYGTCKVFRYSFDKNGTPMGRSDTGEAAWYGR